MTSTAISTTKEAWRPFVLAATVLMVAAAPVIAQQPTARPSIPDSAMAQMMGMMNQMGPMYETMTRAMIEGTLKALEQPATIERLAAFSRHYYDALIKQGFTKEEALQIVAGAGIPAARVGK